MKKNSKIIAGHDTTCVRCQNSFQFCIEGYHKYAHLPLKFGIIPCMTENTSCLNVVVWVGRKGYYQKNFFSHPSNRPKKFYTSISMVRIHAKFRRFFT